MDDAPRASGETRAASRRDRCRRAHIRRDASREGLPVAQNRVAVVTGASSGIGEAIARALAREGWQVVLLARRQERLRALAEELGAEASLAMPLESTRGLGPRVRFHYEVCDVGRREDVERAAVSVLARHPQIHLLVNNAGIPGRAGFAAIDLDRLEEVLRVNYLGAVWCLRAFLPGLEAAGRSDVVNIVSIAGAVAFAPSGPYSASKHAQLAFSRATAAELRGRGIHVHTVNPGLVETEGFPQAATLGSALARRLVVGPEHVARHVLNAVKRDKTETFVPRWYRVGAVAQALAPGLVARLSALFGYRSS